MRRSKSLFVVFIGLRASRCVYAKGKTDHPSCVVHAQIRLKMQIYNHYCLWFLLYYTFEMQNSDNKSRIYNANTQPTLCSKDWNILSSYALLWTCCKKWWSKRDRQILNSRFVSEVMVHLVKSFLVYGMATHDFLG